ncbi:MAG: AMP-binding protein [Chloroflexi bacterium]|nr:AMP-binding protein [Chloroflexota bacterium]
MLLHDYVDYHARETPDAEFAVMGDERYSYREANEQINRVAQAFVAGGIEKGARVAMLSTNNPEYMFLYYGASKAGVVPVTLNFRLVASEWAYIINDSGAEMVFVSGEFVDQIDGIRDELATVKQFVAIGAAGGSGWSDFDSWIADQPTAAPQRSILSGDDAIQMGSVRTQR